MTNEASIEYYFDLSLFEHSELLRECTSPWEVFFHLSAYFATYKLGEIQTNIPKGVTLVEPDSISIGEGTIIEPGAYIQGPCIIGKNCTIRHGAYIRGNVVTGNYCVIGHSTETKNAIFLNYAHAAHFSYVGESILGNHTNLGAGTKCANLRLDKKLIDVSLPNGKIPTHLKKLGLILGDNSDIGCNMVTNPGTLIGKNSACYPGMVLRGFIPSNSLVKPLERNYEITEKKITSI